MFRMRGDLLYARKSFQKIRTQKAGLIRKIIVLQYKSIKDVIALDERQLSNMHMLSALEHHKLLAYWRQLLAPTGIQETNAIRNKK